MASSTSIAEATAAPLVLPSSDPSALAPCRDVPDSRDDAGPQEPQPPVPFILLLLAVSAGVFAVLPFLGGCNVHIHRCLLAMGALLTMPFLAMRVLSLCGGQAWLLERFFEGEYSEGATSRALPCLWHPEKIQILQYTTGEVAGRTIETYAAFETTAIVEYVETARGGNRDGGHVVREEVSELQPGSAVRLFGLKTAPQFNGLQGTCQTWLAGRWRVALHNGEMKDVKPDNLAVIRNFSVTIPASIGTDIAVTMDSHGTLNGHSLPFEASFDGSSIVARSGPRQGQAWRKAGYWRLDFVTKVVIALAVVGIQTMFVAAMLPPGVISAHSARLPLKAVFLVDGSGSVTPQQWNTGRRANQQFVTDFLKVYGSDQGKLNFGFIQFSDSAFVELPLTSDLDSVARSLGSMKQRGGDTNFADALAACQTMLDGYTQVADNSFDVCVLLTDGEDRSHQTDADLKKTVSPDTAVFGIFVGQDPLGQSKLHNLVGCGKAEDQGKHDCNFFASAADFDALLDTTYNIAQDVTHSSDVALCAERSAIIEFPVFLCMVLPYALWYLSCFTVTIAKRQMNKGRHYKQVDHLMLGDQA